MEKTEGLNGLLKRHLGDSDSSDDEDDSDSSSSDDEDKSCPGIRCDPKSVLGPDCICCPLVLCDILCESCY